MMKKKRFLSAMLAAAAVWLPLQAGAQGVETLPYSYGFESGFGSWTVIDSNADGHTWSTTPYGTTGLPAHEGSVFVGDMSFMAGVGAITPDDWLVSPAIALTDTATLRWWHRVGRDIYPAEHYSVYLSTTGPTLNDFKTADLLYDSTLTAFDSVWREQTVSLAAYVGDTVWVAFRHHGCRDQWSLLLDDISVSDSLGGGSDTSGVEDTTVVACPLQPLPYGEDFEAYEPLFHDLPCWTCHYYSSFLDATDEHFYPFVIGDSSGYRSDKALWFYTMVNSVRGLCTPWFEAPSDSLTLSFKVRTDAAPNEGSLLRVAVLTKADDRAGQEWTSDLLTVGTERIDSGWYQCQVTTASLPAGDTLCFCLRHEGEAFRFYIDDLVVRLLDSADRTGVWPLDLIDTTAGPIDPIDTTITPIDPVDTTDTTDTTGIGCYTLSTTHYTLFPNPASSEVTITVDRPATAILLNAMGQEVKRIAVHPGANRLSVATLPRGLYFVKVDGTVKKLIVN